MDGIEAGDADPVRLIPLAAGVALRLARRFRQMHAPTSSAVSSNSTGVGETEKSEQQNDENLELHFAGVFWLFEKFGEVGLKFNLFISNFLKLISNFLFRTLDFQAFEFKLLNFISNLNFGF